MMADMDLTGSHSHESRGDGRIKIWFRFAPRENWLPIDTEGMWAMPVTADTARIDNVPFLQDGLAQGDIVRSRLRRVVLGNGAGRGIRQLHRPRGPSAQRPSRAQRGSRA